MQSSRCTWLDATRVLACLAVVMLHVSAACWKTAYYSDAQGWVALNFYDSAVRWAVPVFVMVSGSLFLCGNKSLREIVRKNVVRIIVAFYCWSLVYALPGLVRSGDVGVFLTEFLFGHHHMWFLPMIAGLYLLVPFLRLIAKDSRLATYYLLLAFVFAFALPQASSLVSLWSEDTGRLLQRVAKMPQFYFALGYSSFFVLGYRLRVMGRRVSNPALIAAGIVGLMSTFLGTGFLSAKSGAPTQVLYENFSITVLMEAVPVFLLLKNCVGTRSLGHRAGDALRALSELSFGVYLVHPTIISALGKIHLDTLAFFPVVSVPVITLIVATVSFGISAVLKRVPVLGRFIV